MGSRTWHQFNSRSLVVDEIQCAVGPGPGRSATVLGFTRLVPTNRCGFGGDSKVGSQDKHSRGLRIATTEREGGSERL